MKRKPQTPVLLRPIDVAVRLDRSVGWVYMHMKAGDFVTVPTENGRGRFITEESVVAFEQGAVSLEERCAEAAHLMLTTAIANEWLDPDPSQETLARVARHLRNLWSHAERVA